MTEMIWGASLTAFNLFSNVSAGLRPWKSWANVHSNFSRVGLFPTLSLPPHFVTTIMILWWSIPASGLIFFAFFGFGEEALKEYKKVWAWITVKVFRRHGRGEKGKSLFGDSSVRSRFVFFYSLYLFVLIETLLSVAHFEPCTFEASNRLLLPPPVTSSPYRHPSFPPTSLIFQNQLSLSPHLLLTRLLLTDLSLDSLNQKTRKQQPTLNMHPKIPLPRIAAPTLVPTLKCTLRPLSIRRQMMLIRSRYPLSLTTAALLPHRHLLIGLN